MNLEAIANISRGIRGELHKAVVGQDHAIDLLLTALLAEGHVLLEGQPGLAKTLLVRAFAKTSSLQFGRIQFTPDLMPGDVLGTNLFNFQSNTFSLTKGPIFTDLLLADEINRTPPKTQAALLQAMQERTVTIDGKHHALGDHFLVVATQNPIEQEGTYPLPEAQLDRFLFKIVLAYPSRDEERAIVASHGGRRATTSLDALGIGAVVAAEHIAAMREVVTQIRVAEPIVDYIVDIVRQTREHGALRYGASPRAAASLSQAARAYAVLAGRDYVLPDDVKALAVPVLAHRVGTSVGAAMDGVSAQAAINQILSRVTAPR
ncbi:MAG: MoxR family ATPase [Myxococcales bacterium]|nr:MoxR family ATPase [Myxococcales bacterium]